MWGLQIGVRYFGFEMRNLGFGIWGLGFLGLGVLGLGFGDYGLKIKV